MARKVVMTGMLMFVSKGSLVQVVVAIVFSVFVLMAVAFLQPYASPSANLFKLGTEAALVFTLIVVVLLKIDLSREGIEDPEWWEHALGSILVMTNTLLPSAGLCVGLLVFGFDQLEVVVDALDNVIPEDSEPDTRAKVKKGKKTKKKTKDKADKGDTDEVDTREVFENPLGDE
jgi:chromate transport protein ChrA